MVLWYRVFLNDIFFVWEHLRPLKGKTGKRTKFPGKVQKKIVNLGRVPSALSEV